MDRSSKVPELPAEPTIQTLIAIVFWEPGEFRVSATHVTHPTEAQNWPKKPRTATLQNGTTVV
jgi:hypothetical protein